MASGMTPMTKANEVIRIGRKRWAAACFAASTRFIPFSKFSFANSTIRIAFLAESPIDCHFAIILREFPRGRPVATISSILFAPESLRALWRRNFLLCQTRRQIVYQRRLHLGDKRFSLG